VFPTPNLALSSIAAPTTATAFLLVSLSKMPRSNPGTLSIRPEAFPIKANDFLPMSFSFHCQSCLESFRGFVISDLAGAHCLLSSMEKQHNVLEGGLVKRVQLASSLPEDWRI
jgi:hypothetical protein